MKKIHGDRILVEQYKESSSSLLIVPDDEHVKRGIVVQIGGDVRKFANGEKILFEEHLSLPIKYDGKDLFILRENDIIATI